MRRLAVWVPRRLFFGHGSLRLHDWQRGVNALDGNVQNDHHGGGDGDVPPVAGGDGDDYDPHPDPQRQTFWQRVMPPEHATFWQRIKPPEPADVLGAIALIGLMAYALHRGMDATIATMLTGLFGMLIGRRLPPKDDKKEGGGNGPGRND
jgi:hypothetical protein